MSWQSRSKDLRVGFGFASFVRRVLLEMAEQLLSVVKDLFTTQALGLRHSVHTAVAGNMFVRFLSFLLSNESIVSRE